MLSKHHTLLLFKVTAEINDRHSVIRQVCTQRRATVHESLNMPIQFFLKDFLPTVLEIELLERRFSNGVRRGQRHTRGKRLWNPVSSLKSLDFDRADFLWTVPQQDGGLTVILSGYPCCNSTPASQITKKETTQWATAHNLSGSLPPSVQ